MEGVKCYADVQKEQAHFQQEEVAHGFRAPCSCPVVPVLSAQYSSRQGSITEQLGYSTNHLRGRSERPKLILSSYIFHRIISLHINVRYPLV